MKLQQEGPYLCVSVCVCMCVCVCVCERERERERGRETYLLVCMYLCASACPCVPRYVRAIHGESRTCRHADLFGRRVMCALCFKNVANAMIIALQTIVEPLTKTSIIVMLAWSVL